jgi:hypothetical protein
MGAAGKEGSTAASLTRMQSVVFSLHFVCLYVILNSEVSPSDSASKDTLAAAPGHCNPALNFVEQRIKS